MLVVGEKHLYRIVKEYVDYLNRARPHQGIEQQIPEGSTSVPEKQGKAKTIAFPVLNGLHHVTFLANTRLGFGFGELSSRLRQHCQFDSAGCSSYTYKLKSLEKETRLLGVCKVFCIRIDLKGKTLCRPHQRKQPVTYWRLCPR